MCKAGLPVPDIKPGVQVPTASNNSSLVNSLVQDSIQNYINITITSTTALIIGFCILAIAVFVVHQISKATHRSHGQRLHTLAQLVGYGEEHTVTSTV